MSAQELTYFVSGKPQRRAHLDIRSAASAGWDYLSRPLIYKDVNHRAPMDMFMDERYAARRRSKRAAGEQRVWIGSRRRWVNIKVNEQKTLAERVGNVRFA